MGDRLTEECPAVAPVSEAIGDVKDERCSLNYDRASLKSCVIIGGKELTMFRSAEVSWAERSSSALSAVGVRITNVEVFAEPSPEASPSGFEAVTLGTKLTRSNGAGLGLLRPFFLVCRLACATLVLSVSLSRSSGVSVSFITSPLPFPRVSPQLSLDSSHVRVGSRSCTWPAGSASVSAAAAPSICVEKSNTSPSAGEKTF